MADQRTVERIEDEAQLFVLYWLDFFGCPMTSDGLNILWTRRKGAADLKQGRLPIAELASAGYVAYGKKGLVSIVASRLSSENLREIWAASETGRWAIDSEFLTGRWLEKAFKPSRDEWYIGSEDYVEDAVCRHVLCRWGLVAALKFQSWVSDRLDIGLVGDDKKLERDVRTVMASEALPRPYGHSGPDTFADIFQVPPTLSEELEKAYGRVPRAPLGYEARRLVRSVLTTSAEALRTGRTVFDPETEAELVAHLAADDFLAGESVQWAVERLNALRKSVPLTPHATMFLQAVSFWRGDMETVRNVDAESPYACGHKRTVAAGLELARAGDFLAAEKELTSAIGLAYYPISDQWHRIDFPILLVLLVCKVRANGGGNMASLKKLLRVLPDAACQSGAVDDYAGNSDLRRDATWIVHFAATLPGVECYSVAERGGKLLPFLYLHALAVSLGCKAKPLDLGDALKAARLAQGSGYAVMAADIASIAQRVDREFTLGEAASEAFGQLGVNAELLFGAPRELSRFWERALDALEQALPHAAAPKRKKSGAGAKQPDGFGWGLELITKHYQGGQQFVGRVVPLLFKRQRDGGFASPKAIAGKTFIEGRHDQLLSPEDGKAKMQLVSSRCIVSDLYGERNPATIDALREMSGMDHLFCWESDYYYGHGRFDRESDLSPLKLTVEPAKLLFGYRADGSVEISIPVSFADASTKFRYVLHRSGDEGEYEWHVLEITPDYLVAVKALAQVSTDRKLVVPPEGAQRIEAFCSSVSDTAPIAWTGAKQKKDDDVPRETTTALPLVRLVFADGALGASLGVRLCEEPLWTSEPGKGAPERLVVRKDSSRVLLVRDFAAEETSVAAARAALLPFDASKTDDTHWYFSGLEESLDALAALHVASANGAFALEWPEGESLKLSELVSHATRVEGGETADYWLGMSGTFTLDDGKVLSFIDLLKSFDVREGAYVRLNEGRYLRLSAALARRLEALKGAGVAEGGRLMISPAAIPALEKVVRETEADDVLPLPEVVKERIATIRDAFASRFTPPSALRCQMRPYQAEGFEWLARLERCGIGACLADDMGLGKTVQLIALLLNCRRKGVSLVVAPASVAFNWRDEIVRFAPTLKIALVGQTPNAGEEDVEALAKANDVIITSYGVLSAREDQFAPIGWNVLVLDEAQAIKNHLTRRAQTVKRLKARFRVVATGTPIENRLTELWSIFDFLNPGMLGGETRFNRELAPHGEASPRLKRLVKPLILRRLKREVLTDLPDKEEITVNVVLGDEERHAYEATRLSALAKLQGGDTENKIAILAELTRLRRFCCHPSLVMPSVLASAKLDALEDLLENLRNSNHRALVFSQFVDYLAIVRKLLERRGWSYRYLDGATSKADRERGVAAFQAGEGDFFLISLKAGGMGLNLTAANYVILLDPWWNPAVENQAADRVHRIGQRLPVTVYRLIAQDTIEEKVVKLHAKKTALAEDVLSAGASALSAQAMMDLLAGD